MSHVSSNVKRKALCIGLEYSGSRLPIVGAHKDCKSLAKVLREKLGYQVTILMDDGFGPDPTKKTILNEIRNLVDGAMSGDRLFLHYSGHGAQIQNLDGTESDGFDEVLVPIDPYIPRRDWDKWDPCDSSRRDWRKSVIVDGELYRLLTSSIPPGCHFLAMFDTCTSGTALDLKFNLRCKELNPKAVCDCLECQEPEPQSPTETLSYQWPSVISPILEASAPPNQCLAPIGSRNSQVDITLWAACRDGTRAWGSRSGGLFVKTFVDILTKYEISKYTLRQLLCITNHLLSKKTLRVHRKDSCREKIQHFQFSSFGQPILDAPFII